MLLPTPSHSIFLLSLASCFNTARELRAVSCGKAAGGSVKLAQCSLVASAEQRHWPKAGRWMYLSKEGRSRTGMESPSEACCTFCCLWGWSKRHPLIGREKNSTYITPHIAACPSAPAVTAALWLPRALP